MCRWILSNLDEQCLSHIMKTSDWTFCHKGMHMPNVENEVHSV